MGQSTDAILFYGYAWDDDERPEWMLDDDGKETEVMGLSEKNQPVLVASHCSCDYPMPYVYIVGTRLTAWRGSAIKVTSVDVDPEWQALLDEFCTNWKIDVSDKEPGWFLVSMWC